MKKLKFLLMLSFILINSVLFSQTLFVPGGTASGIGISTVAGNVGIGNSNPSTNLDVTGHINVGGTFSNPEGFHKSISLRGAQHSIFRMFGGTVSSSFLIDNTTTDPKVRLGTNSSDGFGLYTSGATNIRLYISPAGNLGIGTTTPNAKLEVAGPGRFTGANGFSIGGDMNQFRIQTSTGIANQAFGFLNASNSFEGIRVKQISVGGSYADLYAAPLNGLIIEGNVGIGTTNPQTKLEVAGAGHFNGGRLSQYGTIPNDNNAAFWNMSPLGYGFYSQGGSATRYAFHFLNHEGTTIMYGTGAGNVGIGTSNPDARLTVAGDISSREVRVTVDAGSGPDYVFEKNYNLLPLSELETYITQNKHLPEVPSAKEMEAEGLNLKEMNLILLKKVEELTLHLIEMKKENADLHQRMDKIEKK